MAERKDIQFAYGIRRSPSIADEGELSECVNLIPSGGELINIQPPKDMGLTLPDGHRLIAVHVNSGYKHYITIKDKSVYWVEFPDEGDPIEHLIVEFTGEFKSINVLGNTLCIFTSDASYYSIYKSGSGYNILNSKPVFPNISFRLVGDIKGDQTELIDLPENESQITGFVIPIPSGNITNIRNGILAKLNPMISELKKTKYFVYPFFVRYAYKQYDGSVYMISSPVKMVTGYPVPATVVGPSGKSANVDSQRTTYYIRLLYSSLWYEIENSDELKKDLADWKDLIQSIDIYITPDLTCLDQDGSFAYSYRGQYGIVFYNGFDQYSVSQIQSDCYISRTNENIYRRLDTSYSHDALYFASANDVDFVLPRYNVLYEDNGVLPFYKIYSIGIDDINGTMTRVLPEDGVLDSNETLAAQEKLTAEGQPDGTYLPECTYVYNGRLHLANLRIIPPSYNLEHFFAYRNGYLDTNSGKAVGKTYKYTAYVLLHGDGEQDVAVQLPCEKEFYLPEGLFVYYPDPNAYKLLLIAEDSDGNKLYSSTTLTEHKGLDGAYGYVSIFGKSEPSDISGIGDMGTTVSYPNKMYVSEVNNPFNFSLDGITTIGTGEIKSIVSATKALSQGQFGEFPLYVFCTDGIWSLQVGSTGLYSASHPVSRDVCNNVKSITQIDAAIVFSTERGLKMLQGSDVTLLSEAMDGHNTDESKFNVDKAYSSLLIPDTDAFVSMLASCRITYDYAHSLLHIFPDNTEGKHYVYSLQSGEYSTYVGFTPESFTSDYPNTIVQIGQGLHSFENYVSDERRKGMLITRPISFGDPFTYKILEELRMIYYRSTAKARYRIAVFGSYDNVKYYRVNSLKLTSFKYYRFVVYTEMSDIDTLSGVSAVVGYRATGRLR